MKTWRSHLSVSGWLTLAAGALGALGLLAWPLLWPSWLTQVGGSVAMAPFTGLTLLVLSACLLIERVPWGVRSASLAAMLGGALALSGGSDPFESWLARTLSQGRAPQMADLTSLLLMSLAMSLFFIDRQRPRWALPVAATSWIIGVIYLLGDLFGLPDLGRTGQAPMAVTTALGITLLATAILLRLDLPAIRIRRGSSAGSTLVRHTLPIIVIAPVLLGGVAILIQNWGWFRPPFAALATMVGAMLVTIVISLAAATRLDRQVERENAHLAARLQSEAALESMRVIDQNRDSFYAMITHELRSPLNAISGYGSLLQEEVMGPLNEQQQHCLGQLMSGSDELLGLINDLLDLHSIQAGRFTLNRAPTSIVQLARDVTGRMAVLATNRSQSLTLEAEETLREAMVDRTRIGQVLTNLVANAIKFSQDGARITVRLMARRDSLRLEVVDDGPGIDSQRIGLLFRRFGRLSVDGSIPVSGTGLGLTICKGIVEAHGGEIGVESQPGRGSTFWCTLPQAVLDAPEGACP